MTDADKIQYGLLDPGTVVSFVPSARKLGGQHGIIECFGRSRYRVLVRNRVWTVPPFLIAKVVGADDVIPAPKFPFPKSSTEFVTKDSPQKGDIVLMHIGCGRYDVVVIDSITAKGFSGRCISGTKSFGKTYNYKHEFYVCKLPKDRFQ